MEYTADSLAEQFSWLRPLVVSLLSNESEADDVLQDLALAAVRLGQPVRRAWMAKVARGLSIDVLRKRRSRSRREQIASRPEAVDSTADVVERAATCQSLIDTVMGLDEPLCTTVLRRFWDNQPPRVIAAEMEVSTDTVRKRLKKAQELIRVRMDGAHGGDRRAWAAPLLLHLATPGSLLAPTAAASTRASEAGSGAASTTGTGTVLSGRWAIGTLVAGGLALATWATARTWNTPPSAPSVPDEVLARDSLPHARSDERLASNIAIPRQAPTEGSAREAIPASAPMLSGRCVGGSDEAPLANIEVEIYAGNEELPRARTHSDANGQFTLCVSGDRTSSVVRIAFGAARVAKVVEWDWPLHLSTLDMGTVPIPQTPHDAPALFPDVPRTLHWLMGDAAAAVEHPQNSSDRPRALVESVLGVPQTLQVHVVDSRTGEGVETFGIAVTARGRRQPGPPPWAAIEPTAHPAGTARVSAASGPQTVSVRPDPTSGLAPRRIVLDAIPRAHQLTVSLRPARRRFKVQHAGAPLPGVEVQLVERADPQAFGSTDSPRPTDAHVTAEGGVVEALVPEDRALLAGVRSAAWVAPLAEVWKGNAHASDLEPIALQAIPAASLHGVVEGLRACPAPLQDLEVYLAPTASDRDGPEWLLPEPARVGDDGSFELRGCPPGRWRVRLGYSLPTQGAAARMRVSVAIGTIAGVQPGDRRHLLVPLDGFGPGQLEVQLVNAADQPLANTNVGIWGHDETTAESMDVLGGRLARTNAEGRLDGVWLPPGSYQLMQYDNRARTDQPISLRAGQVLDHSVRLRTRQLVVVFTDHAQETLSELEISCSAQQVDEEDRALLTPVGTTDGDGRLHLPYLPSRTTHFYVRRGRSWAWAGSLDDELRSEERTVEARLAVPRNRQ